MIEPIEFNDEPRRVLIVLPTWVGDVVMATPFLDALFARFDSSEVSLLMYKHLFSILDGGPWTDTAKQIYFWNKDDTNTLVHELKAQQFDAAILLPNSFRVAWFAKKIGAKRRIGFSRDARGWLLTDPLPVPNRRGFKFEPLPLVNYYNTFGQYLGCKTPGDAMSLFTTDEDEASTTQRLEREGIPADATIVTLCPGANFGASKCWHPERFAGVADELVRHQRVSVVISPGPGEEPLAERIAEAMEEKSYLLTEPCLTLGELKSLMKRSSLLIGNDTGPRHYARAFDIPRVTIFGPTEQRWTDTSHDKETIVKVDVPCGPCQKKVCPLKERVCMDRITVQDVYEASKPYLERRI